MARAASESTSAAMASGLMAGSPDPPDDCRESGASWMAAAAWMADWGRAPRGWVCCILTVALGKEGFDPPSGGRVMRAVSFFGWAAFMVTGSATPILGDADAGFNGTVGRAPSDGGFGGGAPPGAPSAPGGLIAGALIPEGGFGGPGGMGAAGRESPPGGAGGAAPPVVGSLLVSFFGAVPSGAAGLPGTLMRTVSRFTAGWSLFGGSVMRIVSFFVASSDGSDAGGFSSAIIFWECDFVVYLTR